MATVLGVLHTSYPHVATHRRTWRIKREGGVAVKNAYTLNKKGPVWLQTPYTQLQDRTTRSAFTVVVKTGMGSSTHVKSR